MENKHDKGRATTAHARNRDPSIKQVSEYVGMFYTKRVIPLHLLIKYFDLLI
jgi:hypothetical protein